MNRTCASLLVVAATAPLAVGCGSDSGSADAGSAGSGRSSGGGGGGYGASAKAPATTSTAAPATATTSSGRSPVLKATESGGLGFAPKSLRAKAGAVTLKLDNPAGNGLPHAIAIEGGGIDASGRIAQPGGTSTVAVKLKAGTYTFYCPVGSHRAQGMQGQLTVE